ncbi:MAG: RNA 2',3'-cyclic phosphodiesterase [Desulfomonile sp.]|jgi:2'-5' RNA ligase|nr:RNA 2',3'-cyclic phosphodiesterase [Deltaproteobacteria bacterium]
MGFKNNEIRTFVAIELSDSVKVFLGEISTELKKTGGDVKWVTPDNIHLTLKFLGNVGLDAITLIQSELVKMFSGQEPFELQVRGVGVFPSLRKPRVIWVGVHDKLDKLHPLAERLETSLAPLGFKSEPRPFRAHLTLGRLRSSETIKGLVEAIRKSETILGPIFSADHAVLFKSELKPNGAEYYPLCRFDFLKI